MVVKFASLFCVVAAAAAVVIPSPVAVQQVAAPITKVVYEEHEAPAQYEYEYSINDPQTGDIKSSKENRNGDDVHGYYSLVQPDGLQRIVEYTSSKEHGFNAVVRYEGQAKVAAPSPLAYAAAPVAKLAYAPASVGKIAYQAPVAYAPAPVAKVAYAQAPVVYKPAQVAYAAPAPVAKVAYTQAPAQVTYAQPAQVTYSQPAQVTYAQAPAQVTYSQPAKVAYAHQPAQVQYTAPAPIAYAQPLTKVAYSPAASVGHVTYASPSASYSH